MTVITLAQTAASSALFVLWRLVGAGPLPHGLSTEKVIYSVR